MKKFYYTPARGVPGGRCFTTPEIIKNMSEDTLKGSVRYVLRMIEDEIRSGGKYKDERQAEYVAILRALENETTSRIETK